ncbi:signal peptidase I [Candidatus Parcubacteria bacterium]|nr:signal peptidase I [Candidatus Parcubacteria bacterium]
METKQPSLLQEMARFAFLTLAIIVPIRLFVAEPFIVSGASMEPTFDTGEYLVVDRLSYHFSEPERGDVIIFRYPKDPSKYFIKRIVGLPGETVEISQGEVTIKNSVYPKGFALDQSYIRFPREDDGEMTLGAEEYFVMGDNRAASSDSRAWGALPRDNIIGRAFIRLFPLPKADLFPGVIETK